MLYLAFILARHGGQLPGSRTLEDGTSLMGLYFGSFAGMLIAALHPRRRRRKRYEVAKPWLVPAAEVLQAY